MNINDITITSLETMTAFDNQSGAHLFTLDELQNATIANTQDKTDITGKGGRKLNSLKKNKAVVISGTNGLLSAGLMEMQTGGEFSHNSSTRVMWTDYLEITDNKATTSYAATGTAGTEIEGLYIKTENGGLGDKLTQGVSASAKVFAYDPKTKAITFAEGAYENGTEIVVYYHCNIEADSLENKSDVYSKKCKLYIDAIGEDKCSKAYHVQFYIPKADFSGNFNFELGGDQVVHAFEAESLAGACGSSGSLWTYTIFGVSENEAAGE